MDNKTKTDAFTIDPDKWQYFSTALKGPDAETPIWVKLDNGRIVLAAYTVTAYMSGYVAVSYEEGRGFVFSTDTGYLLRNASWQPCKYFNL